MTETLSILRAKDVIALEVDSLGLLTIPSNNEPLAEREETVSQLRICTTLDPIESDLNRCMFRIETDAGQVSFPVVKGFTLFLGAYCLSFAALRNSIWFSNKTRSYSI